VMQQTLVQIAGSARATSSPPRRAAALAA